MFSAAQAKNLELRCRLISGLANPADVPSWLVWPRMTKNPSAIQNRLYAGSLVLAKKLPPHLSPKVGEFVPNQGQFDFDKTLPKTFWEIPQPCTVTLRGLLLRT